MPGLTAAGVGSGIDINGLVTQLVAAERAPQEQRLRRTGTRITTQLSALGTLRGALSTLQTSVSSLKTAAAFQARRADSSDKAVFTAAATSGAATGTYTVEVTQLASAQKLASAPYVGGAGTTIGTGTLSLSSGGKSFQVTIGDADKTLTGIRDAINGATGNDSVQATLITAVGGTRLVLTARQPGAVNSIQVTAAGGGGGLDALVYQPGTLTNLSQLAPGQNAKLIIEGFNVESATNVVDGAIGGVSLNLVAAKPGTSLTLSVTNDDTATRDKVRKFVADFNAASGTLAQLRGFNPATREGGPMLGDSMLRGIEASLRRQITTPSTTATAPYTTLNSIGITSAVDGALKLDETRLSAALAADFDSVGKLFGSADGVGVRIADTLERALRADGQVTARSSSLQSSKKALDKDREALEVRMVSVENRYRTQFIAMDTLLSGLQSTGNYLAQQLNKGAP